MRRFHLNLTLLIAAAAGLAGFGLHAENQTGPTSLPTGLVVGVVVDPLTGKPVQGTIVTLGGAAAGDAKVLTDAQGRFVFTDLAKGSYTITATRRGYAEGAYGRRRPAGPGQILPLADAERIGDLQIPIWKHASITGTITDDIGEPMVNVPVRVVHRTFVAGRRRLSLGNTAQTDDRGVYRIGSLTPGEYAIVVPSTQTTAPESVVDVFRSAEFDSEFNRELSLSGALPGLRAMTNAGSFGAGDLTFQSLANTARAGVAPGPAADGRIFVFPTQYHPAATTPAQAAPIALRLGEERDGVDVQLKLVPSARVSGSIRGADGPISIGLSLTPAADDGATGTVIETATTVSDAAGRFTFLGVPAGQYHLRVAKAPQGASRGGGAPPGPADTLWALQPISVDATGVHDLAITLRTGFRISGRVRFENTSSRPLPETIRPATIESVDGRPLASVTLARGQFDGMGAFTTNQLPPGRYHLRVNSPPAGWTLKSAMLDGHDISNVPVTLDRDRSGLVITFTDRPSELNGRVQMATGDDHATATVLIIPSESGAALDGEHPRRLRAIRVDRDGTFRVAGLPAGDYLVAALADEDTADWQDPRMLQAIARVATTVRLQDDETRSLTLRRVTVRR